MAFPAARRALLLATSVLVAAAPTPAAPTPAATASAASTPAAPVTAAPSASVQEFPFAPADQRSPGTLLNLHLGGARAINDGDIAWGAGYALGMTMLHRIDEGFYAGARFSYGRWNRTGEYQNAEYAWRVGPMSMTEASALVRIHNSLGEQPDVDVVTQIGAGYYNVTITSDFDRKRCLYCRDSFDIDAMTRGQGGKPGLSAGIGLLARNRGGAYFEFMIVFHRIFTDNESVNEQLSALVGITLPR